MGFDQNMMSDRVCSRAPHAVIARVSSRLWRQKENGRPIVLASSPPLGFDRSDRVSSVVLARIDLTGHQPPLIRYPLIDVRHAPTSSPSPLSGGSNRSTFGTIHRRDEAKKSQRTLECLIRVCVMSGMPFLTNYGLGRHYPPQSNSLL